MTRIESLVEKPLEKMSDTLNEFPETKELPENIEAGEQPIVEPPDISYIERTSRSALIEQSSLKATEKTSAEDGKKIRGYRN